MSSIDWGNVARAAARNSGCRKPGRAVGAVLVRHESGGDVLIASGTNGPPPSSVCTWTEGKDRSCWHAEQVCIWNARGNLAGTTLYITRPPCDGMGCREMIDRYGIAVVVVPDTESRDRKVLSGVDDAGS